MEINTIRKLIKRYEQGHSNFVRECQTAERYYKNECDILFETKQQAEDGSPLRNADNRVSFNFHGLLVDQKASYVFTDPPTFDIGSDTANTRLSALISEDFPKVCKDLCIEASNKAIAWLHIWKDDQPDGGENGRLYDFAVVPSEQIIPVWSGSLKPKLLGVFRTYREIDEENGDNYLIYEFWNDVSCEKYRLKEGDNIEKLVEYNTFRDVRTMELTNEFLHEIGEVPFIPFYNNGKKENDLKNIKSLIDSYCKVFSGFVNDLEDIQEVIFVLTNYGGQDLNEFLTDLKKYKAIKIENDGAGDRSGVETLAISIPVDARKELLAVTRACIFEQGQGIDPEPSNFGNSSGVALKFLYSQLNLKVGLLESEFRQSFTKFIKLICRLYNLPIEDGIVNQTWNYTSVQNDLELAEIASKSNGIISQETLVKNHPWVENGLQEVEQIETEQEKQMDDYKTAFPPDGNNEGMNEDD